MGPGQAAGVIREAFAMGVDQGALISDRKFGGADVLATSYTIAQGIRLLGEFDLILCGKQTTDGDTAQVGPEVSEWLSIPSVSNVSKIVEIKKDAMVVEMDMTNDIEIAKIQFPCLLAVDKDIFMPRLPSYVKKQETKDREIKVISLEQLEDKDEKHYGLNGSPTQVQRIFPPQVNAHREVWNGTSAELTQQLVDKLKELKFA
jgi:electron transfer flavoprotein beta subunit